MTSDAEKINSLENQLALERAEAAGIASLLVETRDDYIKLRNKKTEISRLGHWVSSFDSSSLDYIQADLAYERLARDYYGEINTASAAFFATPEAVPIGELIKKLSEFLGCEPVTSSDLTKYNLVLFIGNTVVCHLFRPYHETELTQMFIASRRDFTVLKELLEVIKDAGYTVGSKADVEGVIPVTFVMPAVSGVTFTNREFAHMALESIEENYTSKVIEEAYRIIENVKTAKSGIVILNGPPGTGKTYLIRALLSELKDRHAIICTPPALFLTKVDLLASASQASDKPSLMILEDIGDLLAQENVTTHLNETSNFLNLTDGLLSLLTDIIFIVSFNHDISQINPALTRPGRCLGQVEIGKLPINQVIKLVGPEIAGGLTGEAQYSLAEVYEMKHLGRVIKPAHKSVIPGMGGR